MICLKIESNWSNHVESMKASVDHEYRLCWRDLANDKG